MGVLGRIVGRLVGGGRPPRARRSPQWPKVRAEHLRREPVCQFCGGKRMLTVHHCEPVHVAPERELDSSNLLTACEWPDGLGCHFRWCHLFSWSSWNPTVREDARALRFKVTFRPRKVVA